MRRKFYEFEAKVDSIFSHVGLTQNSCRGTYFGDNYKIGISQRRFFGKTKISGSADYRRVIASILLNLCLTFLICKYLSLN